MPVVSNWPNLSYPILVNPTDREIEKFGEAEAWDSLRIAECSCNECNNKDNKTFAVASGLGNTHTSITNRAHRFCIENKLLCRFILPYTYIIYIDKKRFYFNLQDVSGSERCPFKRGI